LKRRVDDALGSPVLRHALADFSARYVKMRKAAFGGLDFEAIRDEVVAVKERAISERERLQREFAEKLEAKGGRVHRADDSAEANQIIRGILEEHGARKVVKSKSITSEEIRLNKALEGAGLEVTETDLGEWIVQLAGHSPSHMVIPAIHMDRNQIAALFSEKLGEEVPPDIGGMVKLARRHLRRALTEADAGITGANIAVAAAGTLIIVTNEGNGGLATSLPRIHIALVGTDKLLPDWPSAMSILRALPPSATGQRMSSYVSFLTGPALEKQHVILLDNGRRRMAESPDFRQALRCLRCGACLNVCPVYRIIGGQAFSHVYMGGIGTILTAFIHDRDAACELAKLCSGCRACATVCPAGIDIPFLIEKVAGLAAEENGLGPIEWLLLRGVMSRRRAYHALMTSLGKAGGILADKDGMLKIGAGALPSADFRAIPVVARESYRSSLSGRDAREEKGERIIFFTGCLADFVYPETARAAERLLSSVGFETAMPTGQGCCGLPAHHLGDAGTARRQAAEAVKSLSAEGAEPIVTVCPTCLHAIRSLWPELLAGTELESEARRIAARAVGISSFLIARADKLRFAPAKQKITYHDSCHVKNMGEGEELAARRLLTIAGYELVETGENSCCGFGGTFSVNQPGISEKMLSARLDSLSGTGASCAATDCPGCVLQIRGGMARRSVRFLARHTVEYLAEALVDSDD